MVCCSLSNCGNSSSTCNYTNKKITFHRFPQDPNIKDEWINATGKRNWFPTNFSRICSVHFKDGDFKTTTKRRTLNKSAIPTVNIWRLITGNPSDDRDLTSPTREPADPCVPTTPSRERAFRSVDGRDDKDHDNGATRSEQAPGTDFVSSEEPNNLPTSQNKDSEPDPTTLNEQALKITLARIRANPQLYIGIPKNCYHLIKILHQQTRIPTTHILLCLKKVKLDTHFEELADQFGISPDEASHIFITNLSVISKALQSFVKFDTQKILPVPFHNYHSTIIDMLELNVQPLSFKSKDSPQTERENTVKYLICRRPDGFIDYVSSGYRGRLSNEAVLENTNYLKRFKRGTCFIVNGFRNVEPILLKKGLKLVNSRADQRTESRQMCDKMQDPTSSIHSNRRAVKRKRVTEKTQNPTDISQKPFNDHKERVVNQVGEFSMVKDCSVVRSELVRVLDDAVVISCALINLQSFVIN